jgi:hypothetical protein
MNSALQVVGEEECGWPVVGVQDRVSVGAVGVTSDVGAACRRDRGYKPLLQVVSSPGACAGRMNSALQEGRGVETCEGKLASSRGNQ